MLMLPACRFGILLGCHPPLLPYGLCQLPITLLLLSQALLHMLQLLHTHRRWLSQPHHYLPLSQLHLCCLQLPIFLL